MKPNNKRLLVAGLLAIGASLCCVTPVLAIILGTSGIASTFSWLESFRPYLIGATILVLGFAWYQKLNFKKEIDCEIEEKPKFIRSKAFLELVTGFAIIMLAFPYYGKIFYPKAEKEIIVANKTNIKTITLEIESMNCTSCEHYVSHTVNQLNGIISVNVSFDNRTAVVEFDNSRTTIVEIEKSINSIGYTVIEIKE